MEATTHQVPTLKPVSAHNAVAALVEMYSGVIADYERNAAFMHAQLQRERATHADQLKEGRALNEKLLAETKELRGLVGRPKEATSQSAEEFAKQRAIEDARSC